MVLWPIPGEGEKGYLLPAEHFTTGIEEEQVHGAGKVSFAEKSHRSRPMEVWNTGWHLMNTEGAGMNSKG